jgi:hypothetical protein
MMLPKNPRMKLQTENFFGSLISARKIAETMFSVFHYLLQLTAMLGFDFVMYTTEG